MRVGSMSSPSEAAPLPPDIMEGLRSIGIHQPSREDALHVRLVDALMRTRGATLGNQLTAMRFEFNQELRVAGPKFAEAKVEYEHYIDVETIRLRAVEKGPTGKPLTRIEAEQMARASDRGYQLYLAYLVAEQHERSIRKFLDTFAAAQDNHRTDRADQRAADSEHARSAT